MLSSIAKEVFTNPAAVSTTAYTTGVAGPNAATVLRTRTGYQPVGAVAFNGTLAAGVPDFARNVVITVTHATAVVALSGTITGVDVHGRVITEAWSVAAGTTSRTFTGAKAFARVDSVSVIAATDASADTYSIGTGQVFGLSLANAIGGAGAAVKELSGGSIVTTGTLVAASTSAAADAIGTYSPAAAPNGATTYQVWYITDQPELT